MIVRNNAKTKPEPDDGPEPITMTPARLAGQLHRIAVELAGLKLRARALAPG